MVRIGSIPKPSLEKLSEFFVGPGPKGTGRKAVKKVLYGPAKSTGLKPKKPTKP